MPPSARRLVGEGTSEATADAWIAAWEAQAARDERARIPVFAGGLGVDRSRTATAAEALIATVVRPWARSRRVPARSCALIVARVGRPSSSRTRPT